MNDAPFPGGFLAWDAPGIAQDLSFPPGHLPYGATGEALYIPGYFKNALTLLRVTNDESLTFSPLVLGDGVYLFDSKERLLFSTLGEIRVYEGTVPMLIQSDGQLHGRKCAFVEGPLVTGFVKVGGGAEAVRFYLEGERQDYFLGRLGRVVQAMGFYFLGDALAMTFLDELNRLKVTVWDL